MLLFSMSKAEAHSTYVHQLSSPRSRHDLFLIVLMLLYTIVYILLMIEATDTEVFYINTVGPPIA